MKHNLTFVLAILTAAILCAPSIPALAAETRQVLEIGQDGWVRIAMQQGNQVMWLNTKQALLIAPCPMQTAE